MSMALHQDIIHGYKTNYKRFEAIVGEVTDEEHDNLLAHNREDQTGWILLENNDVFYGKIILAGESVGMGYFLAGESESVELPKIERKWELEKHINSVIPEAYGDEIKTYVIGEWS